MKPINVLFVYPNRETILRIPLAASILCSVIEQAGHNVKVLDTTFIGGEFRTDIKFSEQKGTVKKSNIEEYIGDLDNRSLETIIRECVRDFPPDLIAVSLIERNYSTTIKVVHLLKKVTDAPVLIGGIMATLAPEMLINNDEIDIICVGEGEGAVADICNAISRRRSFSNIANLWVKENGRIVKNHLRPLVNLDTIPEQNWKPFDGRHIYRSYKGRVHRNGSFEFARGCMKVCSFCVAPSLRNVQKNLGQYHRFKTSERVIEEIENKVKKYNLDLIHFGDTDFLSKMRNDNLEAFAMLYKKRIGLPFLIQSGAETINEDRMKLLSLAGCENISVGVESGSDRVRKQVIKKHVSKKKIIEAFKLGRKYKIRMTANYMLGLPDETEEDIMETIRFNRLVNPPAIAAFYFTPFVGTELYNVSLEKGYIKGFDPAQNLHKESPLEMPHLPQQKVKHLLKQFVEDFEGYKDEY